MTKPYWITEEQIKSRRHTIVNGRIERFDVNISDDGTSTELAICIHMNDAYGNPLADVPLTKTLGPVILALAELLGACEPGERGYLSDFEKLPCRVIRHHTTMEVIGIGHFLYDRFVLFEDMISALK